MYVYSICLSIIRSMTILSLLLLLANVNNAVTKREYLSVCSHPCVQWFVYTCRKVATTTILICYECSHRCLQGHHCLTNDLPTKHLQYNVLSVDLTHAPHWLSLRRLSIVTTSMVLLESVRICASYPEFCNRTQDLTINDTDHVSVARAKKVCLFFIFF